MSTHRHGACGTQGRSHEWAVTYDGARCKNCTAYISARAFEDFKRTCSVLGARVFAAAMKASREEK